MILTLMLFSSAMYALSISDEGDCYQCFPPDPGIETAALDTGTGESALSSTTSASASLTFTLDSGASRSFFRDRTTLTPLSRPVAVSLADPSGGLVLSRFSTVLPCPAAPSGTMSGLYLPSFSTNLRAAPHSSQFPPTEAPLQTLHMDVWGPAHFYHPTSRCVLSSQDVTFDESVPYYRLFPYRIPSLPPPPLFLTQLSLSRSLVTLVLLRVLSLGVLRLGVRSLGLLSLGVLSLGVATPGGAEPGGAGPGGATSRGALPGGAGPGGAEPGGAPPGGSPGASSRREPHSPQELREWFARRWSCATGAGGSSAAEGAAVAGPQRCSYWEYWRCWACRFRLELVPAEGVGAETTSGGPAGVLQVAAGGSGAAGGAAGAGAPAGLTERREPASRPTSPVCPAHASGRGSRPCPPPVPGTHTMSLHPSTAPLRAPLLSPPESSLPALADPESDSLRAASPTVTRLLATVVTDPSFESAAAVPLGTDVLEERQEEFQCLAAASPHLVSVLLTPEGDPDALDIPTPRSYAEAIEGPYSSQWQAAMDAKMASWKSTGTYVDAVPPPGANIVSGMWIFRVKRPPGSPRVFKARYVARGFIHGLRQAPREWHDTLRTTLAALGFAPSTADPSLFLRTDTSLPPFYILVYVDDLVFATADTTGLAHVKSELLEETHVH
ncbi:unnamed protein product [Closterium sp. NIES-64]|nr:unnamed protein product [Closterium sp. NIES-64]